ISTLFKRNYIASTTNGRGGIEATEIGFQIIQSMRKYVPSIVSTDLTKSMEEQLEEIESGKVGSTLVIENAIEKLKGTMITFKESDPLPQKGSIKTTWKTCALCRWPVLRTIYAAKHSWELCINKQCPSTA